MLASESISFVGLSELFIIPFYGTIKSVQLPKDKALFPGHHVYSKCT